METDKKVPPNTRDILRIFATYWDNQVAHADGRPLPPQNIGVMFFQKVHHMGGGEFIGDYRILVKPLSKIIDKDKRVIEQIENPNGIYKVEWADELHGCGVEIDNVPGGTHPFSLQSCDYLRSRGYALPYGKWSIEELVQFGIFKLEE